ncbi:MAG: glycosyltransferase 61 family protein [Pseudomonadota bacterium]
MKQTCGVYDQDGVFQHHAALWRGGVSLTTPSEVLPLSEAHLPGRWMWGGVLLNHFGHFLTEATSRFWAFPDLADDVKGIAFIHKRNGDVSELHHQFLKLCDIEAELKVIKTPTIVDELIIPGQGFGLGPISFGTAAHQKLFRSAFAKDITPDGPDRLYVSRSGLVAVKGGVIAEEAIEAEMAKNGYEIFHPQRYSLDVQLARYKAAKKIVGLDGSAFHLAGFALRPDQDVAMIKRRSSTAAMHIVSQLHGASGKAPPLIDVIDYDWIVESRGRADRFSIGQINMPALGRILDEHGFIDHHVLWDDLDPSMVKDEIAALSKRTKQKYVARPTRSRIRADRRARRAAREALK